MEVSTLYIAQLIGVYYGNVLVIAQVVDTLPNRDFIICQSLSNRQILAVNKDRIFVVHFVN